MNYTFNTESFPTGSGTGDMVSTTVVSDRDTFDRDGSHTGHWHYEYVIPGSSLVSVNTTITGPMSRTIYVNGGGDRTGHEQQRRPRLSGAWGSS